MTASSSPAPPGWSWWERARRERWVIPALLALAPWPWFAVRDLSPSLDAVALLLPLVVLAGIAACVVGLAVRGRIWLVPLASWLVFGAAVVLGPLAPERGPRPVDPVRVGSVNLAERYRSREAIVEAIISRDLDVIAVEELTDPLQREFASRFAHGATTRTELPDGEPDTSVSRVGVFSRHPIERLGDQPRVPGLRVRIMAPGRPFVLYALHVPRPDVSLDAEAVSFAERRRMIDELVSQVRGERGPVVLMGDLNASDRTSDYRRLREVLDDAVLSGWGTPTAIRSPLYWALVLRSDHVLRSPGWCAAEGGSFDVPDSDHRGVQAEIGPCPAAE